MPHTDQPSTVEFRAIATAGPSKLMIYRPTDEELRQAIGEYRRFGYDVSLQQRVVGPWNDSPASDEERSA